MQIHFYGTGASEGFPAMFCTCKYCQESRRLGGKNIRTRSGAKINSNLLIDFSVDNYAHVVYGGLDMSKIDYILLTHSHIDHFLPENMINALPPMADYQTPHICNIYGNHYCRELAQKVLSHFEETEKHIIFNEIQENIPFIIGEYTVIPYLANHDPKENCFIYVIQNNGKTLLYGHDSAMYTKETWQQLEKYHFDCVVMDCTSIMKTNAFSTHMGFNDNIAIRKRMLEFGMAGEHTCFIATHFAHTFNPLHEKLTRDFAPYSIIPAYDGFDCSF